MVVPLTHLSDRTLDVFCVYAREDEKFYSGIEKCMLVMQRRGTFRSWSALSLDGSPEANQMLEAQLTVSSITLLLISPAFIQLDDQYIAALEEALAHYTQIGLRILPILLHPVDLAGTRFAHIPFPASLNTPLSHRGCTRDESCFAISVDIRRLIEEMSTTSCLNMTQQYIYTQCTNTPTHLWYVPYARNPHFAGREKLLRQLHHVLMLSDYPRHPSQKQRVTLCGPVGYGKTQIALEYAYRNGHMYSAVLWANAESDDALALSYEAIARILDLPENEDDNQALIISGVRQWLNTHTNWLLILDNAQTLARLNEFIPMLSQGAILITTTTHSSMTTDRCLPVDELPPEEATTFLLRQADILQSQTPLINIDTDALDLACFLKGDPTALAFAAAFLQQTACSPANYYRHYRHQQKKQIKDHFESPIFTLTSADTTCLLNLAQISAPALDILRLCAFLPNKHIPLELFATRHHQLSFGLYMLSDNPTALDEALETLHSYALIQRESNDETFSLPPLVQILVQAELSPAQRKTWAEQAVYSVNVLFPTHFDAETRTRCQRALPLVQVCAQLIQDFGMQFFEAFSVLSRAGYYLRARGQLASAESLYQHSFSLLKKVYGPEDPHMVHPLRVLAKLALAQSRPEQAEVLLQRALAITEQAYGPNNAQLAELLYELAELYHTRGDNERANALITHAQSINESLLQAQ